MLSERVVLFSNFYRGEHTSIKTFTLGPKTARKACHTLEFIGTKTSRSTEQSSGSQTNRRPKVILTLAKVQKPAPSPSSIETYDDRSERQSCLVNNEATLVPPKASALHVVDEAQMPDEIGPDSEIQGVDQYPMNDDTPPIDHAQVSHCPPTFNHDHISVVAYALAAGETATVNENPAIEEIQTISKTPENSRPEEEMSVSPCAVSEALAAPATYDLEDVQIMTTDEFYQDTGRLRLKADDTKVSRKERCARCEPWG